MQDNIIGKNLVRLIDSVDIQEGKSKEGNPYCYLNIKFKSGYNKRAGFLNEESLYVIKSIYSQAQDETRQDFQNQAF